MQATQREISNALSFITEQTGLSLPIAGIDKTNRQSGVTSLILDLKDSVWMSSEYTALERIAQKYPAVFTMQQSGYKMVIVTYKA